MKSLRAFTAMIAAGAIAIAVPALAHPKLVRAAPGNATVASNVSRINLAFSEPLVARLSSFDVIMTGMPGHPAGNHRAMKMNGVRVSLARDGKTLTAALARPLPAGSYTVNWRAVSTDTHRITGRVSFTVR